MVELKSIQKFKNKQGKIIGYRLIDNTGNIEDIDSKNLKYAIQSGEIHVTNLTLTSDNRLIDAGNCEDTEPSKVLPIKKIIYLIKPRNHRVLTSLTNDSVGTLVINEVRTVENAYKALLKARMLNAKTTATFLDGSFIMSIDNKGVLIKQGKNVKYSLDYFDKKVDDLIQDKVNIDLIAHPLNRMTNKTYGLEEIRMRFIIITGQYRDYFYNGDISHTNYRKLIEYNWRIFKSYIPIFEYWKKEFGMTESQFKDILLGKLSLDTLHPYKDYQYINTQDIKYKYYKYSDIPLNITKIALYDVADAFTTLFVKGLDSLDLRNTLYIQKVGEKANEIIDKVGIYVDTTSFEKSRWAYLESIIMDGKLDTKFMDDYISSWTIDGKNNSLLAIEESIVSAIMRSDLKLLKTLKIAREFSDGVQGAFKDYLMQIDDEFIESVHFFADINNLMHSISDRLPVSKDLKNFLHSFIVERLQILCPIELNPGGINHNGRQAGIGIYRCETFSIYKCKIDGQTYIESFNFYHKNGKPCIDSYKNTLISGSNKSQIKSRIANRLMKEIFISILNKDNSRIKDETYLNDLEYIKYVIANKIEL